VLPIDIVNHLLRAGRRISAEDTDVLDAADCAVKLGVISLTRREYVRCVWREDADFLERDNLDCEGKIEITEDEDGYYCPECGQPVADLKGKRHFAEYESVPDIAGIQRYLTLALRNLPSIVEVEEDDAWVWQVTATTGNRQEVVLSEYADSRYLYRGLFFSQPTLYVAVSPIAGRPMVRLEEHQFVTLTTFLTEPVEAVDEMVRLAAVPIHGRRDYDECQEKFDQLLARYPEKERWGYFEQVLIPALVRHVAANPELAYAYLDALRRLHGTIFGEYHVPIGGAGVTDLRAVDKYEVMNDFFSGQFIGDAKCYVKSKLSYDDIVAHHAHLDVDPTHPRRGIIFVASDDIASTAWNFVMQLRQRYGYWRMIIIRKYELLEMISELNATHLLD